MFSLKHFYGHGPPFIKLLLHHWLLDSNVIMDSELDNQ